MMIERVRKGEKRLDFADLDGRIVMVDACLLWEAYREPCRVVSDGGRFVVADGLTRHWDEKVGPHGRHVYFDEVSPNDRGHRIDKRSIRIVCDNANEVNALIAASEEAEAEFDGMRKRQIERIDELCAGEPDQKPSSPAGMRAL